MNPGQNSRGWKRAVKICLALLLSLDAVFVYVDWSARSAGPQAQVERRNRLEEKARLLTADVAKGKVVEKQLPAIQKDCDQFYQQYLLSGATGYSVIVADLNKMARDAGVQASDVKFNPTPIKDRNLVEVAISSDVQGDYQGLIRFLNLLERSQHFYVLNGLTLESAASGPIKLNLSLRTYFRS